MKNIGKTRVYLVYYTVQMYSFFYQYLLRRLTAFRFAHTVQPPNMKSESCGGSDCTQSIIKVTGGGTLIYLLLGAGNTSLIWNPKHSKNKDIQNTSSSLGPNSYLFVRNRVFVFQCQVCLSGIGWLGHPTGLVFGTQAPRRTHHGNCCPV